MQKVEGSSPFIRFLSLLLFHLGGQSNLNNLLNTRRSLAASAAVLGVLLCTTGVAGAASSKNFKVTSPRAGVVPIGKIPVQANLKTTRKSGVKRARFYLNGKLVTTDRRYPFAIKRGVTFDTSKLGGLTGDLKLMVRYRRVTPGGRASTRTLRKSIRITTDVTSGGAGCAKPMILCEEFNGGELNKTIWSDQRTDPKSGTYPWFAWNSFEHAHYSDSPENVSVSGGQVNLRVTDAISGKVTPEKDHRKPKTTGSLNTAAKFDFRYGYIEARIKVDYCQACWQSFWLYRSDFNARPEVDIMEYVMPVSRSPFTVLHGKSGGFDQNQNHTGSVSFQVAGTNVDLTGGWHTFGMRWTPNELEFNIDGKNKKRMTDPDKIPDTKMFLILSMAIADPAIAAQLGYPGVQPAPAGTSMQVDYVRIWPL